ncbi:MAG: hypothetical protein Q9187_001502 [Circinaria calcarea]
MNWTGGRLQRSKHAANGLSAKQKQYFAAARARLQGGSRVRSPSYVTFFEGTDQEIRLLRHGRPTIANDREHYGSQERAVESGFVAARDDRKRCLPSDTAEQRTSKRQSSKRENPSVKANRRKPEACDHDRYQRLPETEDELQAARLEILEMMKRDDWLRPKVPKPLKMTFPSFEEKQKVGRRRKLTKADIARRNQVTHQRSPPVQKERSGLSRVPRRKEHGLDHDEVSVRVGSVIHGSQRTDKGGVLAPANSYLPTSHEILDDSTYSPEKPHLPLRLDTQPVFSAEMPMYSMQSSKGRLTDSIHSQEMPINSTYSIQGKLLRPMHSDNLHGESMNSDEMLLHSIHSDEAIIESLCSKEMLPNQISVSDAPRSAEHTYETCSAILNAGECHALGQDLLAETSEEVVRQFENLGTTGLAYKAVQADSEGGGEEIADHLHPMPNATNTNDELQVPKDEKPDDEAVWFKWVFGYDKTKDEENDVPELSPHDLLVETAADTPKDEKEDDVSSIIAEASRTPPEASTPTVSKNSSMSNQVDTSPDPLSIDSTSSCRNLPSPHPGRGRLQPRVVFKKPALFGGQGPRTATVHIGKNVRSRPVEDPNGSGRPKSRPRAKRRSRLQTVGLQWSSDGEEKEEIED